MTRRPLDLQENGRVERERRVVDGSKDLGPGTDRGLTWEKRDKRDRESRYTVVEEWTEGTESER